MAARKQAAKSSRPSKGVTSDANSVKEDKAGKNGVADEILVEEHLPPLFLVGTVLVCSGALFVLSMRDFLMTGRIVGGEWDEAFLTFSKSMQWFDDSKGWKSQQGGLSAIKQATSDDNNMGGFFVRKMAGAVGMAAQFQKLFPLLAHPSGAQWAMGHFRPLLLTALAVNLMSCAFYMSYLETLSNAGASELPKLILGFLMLESVVIIYYVSGKKATKKGPAIAMKEGKTPSSVPSRIVSRTITIVSSVIALVALRDLFFPGFIFDFFPHDDIYLEWTNALLHSPPEGSPEAMEHGLEAPLYIGDKFVAQLMAFNILMCCVYKMVSAFSIRYGSDGSGMIKAKMFWKAMFVADALMLFVFRLFVSAAITASLDLRWHIMAVAYETFILGLYGFF